MNKIKLYLLLCLITFNNGLSTAQNQDLTGNETIISFLPEHVEIVGLGDPSHQESTITKFRVDLIKQLVEERQFKVIALEGNLYELHMAYQQFIENKDVSIVENAMYHQLNIPEMEELYRYVHDRTAQGDTIIITGFDATFSGNTFVQHVKAALSEIDFLSEDEKQDFTKHLEKAAITNLSALFRNDKKVKSNIVHYSKLILESYKASTTSDYFFEQALKNLIFLYDENGTRNSANRRDLGMATNLAFLRKMYDNKKIILFGSSTHLLKCPQEIDSPFFQNDRETLGEQLNKQYQDAYYFIAYSALSGARSNLSNKPKKLAPPKEGSLEHAHQDTKTLLVLDKKNSHVSHTSSRFLGHAFLHLEIWKVMDALVLIQEVEPASIKKK